MFGRGEGLMKNNPNSKEFSSINKILITVALAATMGCLFALHHHKYVIFSQVNCLALKEKYVALEEQNEQLRGRIKLEEQIKEDSQNELVYYGQQNKDAGPFGTVKSIRTNPLVVPNQGNQRLATLVKSIAVNKELIVALSNSKVIDVLAIWAEHIKRVGITNYIVVALDDQVFTYCNENRIPVYKRDPDNKVESIGKQGTNHAVSGLKFRILREFLELGYSVLLSDIDVIFLQNPFRHLYRDCDIESMSDGHMNLTVYGFDQSEDNPEMGWGRYVHTMRIWVYNSGFFYIRPTVPSIELLDRVAARVAKENVWDQRAFNEELFIPSHPGYLGLHASRRTMDMYEFMNSKTLFKVVRENPKLMKLKPVVVHLNSHPEKMAVVDYYVNGKKDALMAFPVGSQ